MITVKGYGRTRQGSVRGESRALPGIQPKGAVLGARHRDTLLSLLSASDTGATTAELARTLKLSTEYVGQILGNLLLEGRVEKAGRGIWVLP